MVDDPSGETRVAPTHADSESTGQEPPQAPETPGYMVESGGLNPETFKARVKRIWALARKEVKTLWNDRFAMLLLVLLPLFLLFTVQRSEGRENRMTGGASTRMQKPVIGLSDRDQSTGFPGYDLSEEMMALFKEYEQNDQCRLVLTDNQTELERLLGTGEINAYVIIPDSFEYNLSIHFMGVLEVYIDTLNNLVVQDVESLIDEITSVYSEEFNFTGAIHQVTTVENVPEKATRLFQVMPFFFPIVIFSITMLVNSQSLVSDIPKDRITLSPAKKDEIVVGKLLGAQVINTLMVVVLFGASLGFGLRIRGSLGSYFLVMWLVALVGTATGLALSSLANTSLAAFQLFILVFLLQMTLLFFIQDKNVLQFFAIYAGREMLEKIVLRGQSFASPRNSRDCRVNSRLKLAVSLQTRWTSSPSGSGTGGSTGSSSRASGRPRMACRSTSKELS
ncbi:MAG: ABC transporter permease [Promethearchaeota archaeon]